METLCSLSRLVNLELRAVDSNLPVTRSGCRQSCVKTQERTRNTLPKNIYPQLVSLILQNENKEGTIYHCVNLQLMK